MLAIDFKKSRIVNIRLVPKELERTKAFLLVLGSSTRCFTCFVLVPFQFCLTKCQTAQFAFVEFEHCFWWTVSVPRLWFRFVSKTRLFPEILIVHICRTPFAKTTNRFFMMRLNDRHGANSLIVFDKAQSAVLVCWRWLRPEWPITRDAGSDAMWATMRAKHETAMRCDAKILAMRVIAAEILCDAVRRYEKTSDAMPRCRPLRLRHCYDYLSVNCAEVGP